MKLGKCRFEFATFTIEIVYSTVQCTILLTTTLVSSSFSYLGEEANVLRQI